MARIFAARLSSERPSTEALAALRLSARTPRMEGGLAGGAGSGGAKVMIVSSSACGWGSACVMVRARDQARFGVWVRGRQRLRPRDSDAVTGNVEVGEGTVLAEGEREPLGAAVADGVVGELESREHSVRAAETWLGLGLVSRVEGEGEG
eukprot:scaffold52257_cov29-Phaeocystis_antarctica.AAC.1